MVCENIKSWLLPFRECDFGGIDSCDFATELENAKQRALFIMTASPCGVPPGWGISQETLDQDLSGQLQKALQLLTSAEFLSMYIDTFGMVNSIGEYESPNGERLRMTAEDLNVWKNQEGFYRNKAEDTARPFIANCSGSGLPKIRTYNFESLERNFRRENPRLNNPLRFY